MPGHSFKFAAALQAAQGGSKPILIRIETSAGHGAGTPTAKLIETAADSYAFLVHELAVDLPKEFAVTTDSSNADASPRTTAMPYVEPTEQLVTEIFVRDLQQSIDFYGSLGFELVRREGTFAELSWEKHLLFLDEHKNQPAPPERPLANVRVMVPDVDRYWSLCEKLHARVVAPIDDRYYGLRDFMVADPDGYGVRFASLLPPR